MFKIENLILVSVPSRGFCFFIAGSKIRYAWCLKSFRPLSGVLFFYEYKDIDYKYQLGFRPLSGVLFFYLLLMLGFLFVGAVSFRPLSGVLFFYDSDWEVVNGFDFKVSVPYRGFCFFITRFNNPGKYFNGCFRPLSGVLFFYVINFCISNNIGLTFPSPIGGFVFLYFGA